MPTTLLVDSDIVAYKFAAAAQTNIDWDGDGNKSVAVESLEKTVDEVKQYLSDLYAELRADRMILCLSCPTSENWRLKVLDSYKANRKDMVKPVHLGAIKDWMVLHYETYQRPTLEADDVMGILSTSRSIIKGTKVIVSEDKDMQSIPGLLFNPRKDTEIRQISEEEADKYHLYQTLIGDATDNYKGCPGIGPVKAEKILMWAENDQRLGSTLWERVVDTYESKGLTEEDALVQARVARICRASDYNFKRREVKLWQPPTM